ncbi:MULTISPECIES: endonuclease/exonuclease/phosphatase family protein [unclassified Gemella]|uniref:endonuclease/exonuclease/phosphatase family protein n=1 Tax=unclassified Gemella TaxID=2624949 RepID=UPI001073D62A|nr:MULTISPECIES: endonuclease/exonuclease/phosphatase family protein [unclassified Gemella]MBF0710217.1 endonuclease/exonuclease/phosphatase family protein [Gemella sp. GL1.1]MBF0746517.1 endonuclease/exonuclease/phosphatase family protein [Gemella sp. 19428wG2_WT2a]NYS27561.1 endonuclease/exonuclease/phosphatase family protein [Gemella sp. GL1]TFU60295.1 endonuclease [Gemella sp. WT2a]
MKLLTVNVHSWQEDNQEKKIEILAKEIAEKDYDLVALQEVSQLKFKEENVNEINDDNYLVILFEKLKDLGCNKYNYYWSNSHTGYDIYDEGIAILTKLPVLEIDEFYCSRSTTVNSINSRKILRLCLEWKDKIIEAYSCHINLPTATDENQLENIQTILDRSKTKNLKIFLGDFNTDAISRKADYKAILDLGLIDTYNLAKSKDSGITVEKSIDGWSNHSEEKRLDYIFLSKEKEVLSSSVIFNGKNKDIISDHFGLEVELKI